GRESARSSYRTDRQMGRNQRFLKNRQDLRRFASVTAASAPFAPLPPRSLAPSFLRLTLPDPEPIIASSSRRCLRAHSFREMPRALEPLQEIPKGIVERVAV